MKPAPQSVTYSLPQGVSVTWLNLDISDVFRSENLIDAVASDGGSEITPWQKRTLERFINENGNKIAPEWATDKNTEILTLDPQGYWGIGSLFRRATGSLRTYRLPVRMWAAEAAKPDAQPDDEVVAQLEGKIEKLQLACDELHEEVRLLRWGKS